MSSVRERLPEINYSALVLTQEGSALAYAIRSSVLGIDAPGSDEREDPRGIAIMEATNGMERIYGRDVADQFAGQACRRANEERQQGDIQNTPASRT